MDNDSNRPATGWLADGMFHLKADAAYGAWLRVEASADMRTWEDLGAYQAADGALHFVDADAQDNVRRFYRAVPLTFGAAAAVAQDVGATPIAQ